MPGTSCSTTRAVQKVKQMIDDGDLGEIFCIYGNRQNLGIIRKDENALWSLGVHDLSVILYLLDEEPEEVWAHGNAFLTPGVEDVVFCYLRFPSGGSHTCPLSVGLQDSRSRIALGSPCRRRRHSCPCDDGGAAHLVRVEPTRCIRVRSARREAEVAEQTSSTRV